ncbi:uncharacterized protein LOC125869795 [Solanum stenotomum]|uniref:uncharacterized protein LOC125869795 n=1 Tax=Solanum stenotomum TaxID=172797 RepID=UPI0020D0B3FE|nr:uncharacterized protein LOC125869795 [Solanum stenotomum]
MLWGVTNREKVELSSYQFKDVAQVRFTQWKSNWPKGAGPIEWAKFKKEFVGRYFPCEQRQCKVEDFIILEKGRMNVEEHSLNFTLLSKNDPSFVCNPRDEMSRFVTGVPDLVEEECRMTMLHDDMNISRLMVYAQSIVESKLKRENKELNRGRSEDQGQPRFKMRAPNQDSSTSPKVNQERGSGPPFAKHRCHNCGKKHHGK